MAHSPAPEKQSGISRLLDRLRRVGGPGTHGIVDRLDLATPLGRARLARLGAWALLAALALSAVAALFTAAHAVRLAGRPHPTTGDTASLGPAGWAESYITTYVSAGAGREDRLKPFLADPPALESKPDTLRTMRTTVADARQVRHGYWSITIAADLVALAPKGRWTAAGRRYFRVAVAATAEGFIATAPPAVIAGPARGTPPPLIYDGTPLTSTDPAFAMVAHFLDAYLAGQGELVRYLGPGTRLTPITPPPFSKVSVLSVTPARPLQPPAGDAPVPPIAEVLADVRATDRAGRVQNLTYALRLAVRDGQLVVAALQPAPLLAPEQKGSRS